MNQKGFTLIEVLLALAIIAISLTALIKSTTQSISTVQHIKNKSIEHWVAQQGVVMIQSGLISVPTNQEVTKVTTMFGKKWYWRVTLEPTPIKRMQRILIKVSSNASGPFTHQLTAFKVHK